MLARISLVACLALSVALAGCGRRGPLEPPPGAPVGKPAAAPVAAPAANANTPGGLFRNTSTKTDESVAAPGDKNASDTTPFVLDPLL